MFASAGADDQIAMWDLALEKDEEVAPDPELAVKKIYLQNVLAPFKFSPSFNILGSGPSVTFYSSRAERDQGNPLASTNSRPRHQHSSQWLQHFQNN